MLNNGKSGQPWHTCFYPDTALPISSTVMMSSPGRHEIQRPVYGIHKE